MDVKLEIPFEQLLRIIRHLTPSQRRKVQAVLKDREKGDASSILAFSGAFADMSDRDFAEFTEQLKATRAGLFERGALKP